MSRNRLLLIFGAAGLILALVLGVYFYRVNLGPNQNDVTGLIRNFTEKIASGDLEGARALMTEETRIMLRDPGTILGQTVYNSLKLKSVDRVYNESSGSFAADVILTVPDTLKIMTKAGILFGEQVTEQGPMEDPDQAIAAIYKEILSRDDIPLIDSFCVIRMEMRNGKLLILGTEALRDILEGSSAQSLGILEAFSGK